VIVVPLDYSATPAGGPLIRDERLQRVLDLLAAHLRENEGPVGAFMEFVLDLVTAQYGVGTVVPDGLLYGADSSDAGAEIDDEAFGVALGIIGEHLEAQYRGDIAAASTEPGAVT
jgi:hypothetical protein